MSRRFKKLIAVVCAIAMVVTSVTVYKSADVKASGSATVDGKVYTVTDGPATITGFTCQGIFDNARIHFAWGSEVTADTIKATIDGTEVTIDGKNGHGFFIPLTAISSMETGEHAIVVTATEASTSNELTGNATLKIEDQGETTTVVAASGPEDVAWDTINWLGNGVGDASYTERFKAYVLPTNVANLEVINVQVKDGVASIYMPNSNSPAKAVTVNGKDVFGDCKTDGAQTFVPVSVLTAATYNTVVLTNVNNQELTAFIYNKTVEEPVETTTSEVETPEVTTPSETEVTEEITTADPGEAFDPSTITDWTPVLNSTTMSYYIADGAADKVSVKPQVEGDNIYIAFGLAATFKSVTLDGVSQEVAAGAFHRVMLADLTEGYHTLVVEDHYGNEKVTIYFKVEKEPETTEAPTKEYVDGEVLVNKANITKELSEITGGDPWQAEVNDAPVSYVQGKKYVAEVVISSSAAKKIKLVFQNADDWSFIDAVGGYETDIAAGNKVKVTYVFDAGKSTNNGNFDIYLGYPGEATTVVVESKKLTTYNEVPEGVATGVEILSTPQPTGYNVTVDGGEATIVEEGATYTLPTDSALGYVCGDTAYKAGAEVTVTSDMAFTSIGDVSVTAAEGAGIRFDGTAGIRFQAKVTADEAVLSSAAVKTGMLITANDIYENNGDLTVDCGYTMKNIVNSGWYNGEVGTYCGSMVNIAASNYIRKFIARAYVTITYADGATETVYSNMTGARSIQYVASKVQAANYAGVPNEYKATIDEFAAAK